MSLIIFSFLYPLIVRIIRKLLREIFSDGLSVITTFSLWERFVKMRMLAYVLQDGGAMIFVDLVSERNLVNFRLTGLAVLASLEVRGLAWEGCH